MDVGYLILADAATVAEGKHYIHGAGWDSLVTTTFPFTQSLTVAAQLRTPWHETNQQHVLEVDVVNEDGASILPPPGPMRGPVISGRPPQLPQGADVTAPFVFTLGNVPFERPGTYAVVIRVDGLLKARYPFHVTSLVPQAQPPAIASESA
jgi:hypothetical protein